MKQQDVDPHFLPYFPIFDIFTCLSIYIKNIFSNQKWAVKINFCHFKLVCKIKSHWFYRYFSIYFMMRFVNLLINYYSVFFVNIGFSCSYIRFITIHDCFKPLNIKKSQSTKLNVRDIKSLIVKRRIFEREKIRDRGIRITVFWQVWKIRIGNFHIRQGWLVRM